MQRNSTEIFYEPEDIHWASAAPGGCPEGGTTHLGAPGAPRWVVPTSVASRTPSLHYKFPNIPKPLGVTLDQKSCRRKVSVSAKTNLDHIPAPCRRGEIISDGHLHHPGGHHDEEGVVHPRG